MTSNRALTSTENRAKNIGLDQRAKEVRMAQVHDNREKLRFFDSSFKQFNEQITLREGDL